jgi:MoaA/NifB/PqqE/SkfB family radical SAM enzyme
MFTEIVSDLTKVAKVFWTYKKTLKFILKKRGVRGLYNFLFVKLFVADEGGEISLLDPLLSRFPHIAPYPYKIEVEHTTKCNKKCIICEHTYWDEESREVSFEEFKRIVDQFPRLKWINVTGEGSGFLNKDFLKIIRYLRSRDISVNFVDEFDFLTDEIARELIKIGVNCIWISMDGATKETYEKIKVGCSFEKTLRNIKNFIRLKEEMKSPLPTLCFRYIVNKLNVHEMPQFIELVHSFGDTGEGSRVEFAGLLKFKEIEHLFVPEIPEEILKATLKKAKELNVRVTFAHAGKLKPMKKCAAWTEPYIMIGGYVLPCCAVLMSNKRPFLRKYSFGNLLEKHFKEIWNSERYVRFRQMVPKDKGMVPILCKGCRAFDTSKREQIYGIDYDT